MTQINRFDAFAHISSMKLEPDGDYVLYSDHVAAIAAVRQQAAQGRKIDERDKEIEELRARVAELEGNAPRWARGLERNRLEKLGWLVAGGEMVWHRSPGDVDASWHCLMVPPIQLPEGE